MLIENRLFTDSPWEQKLSYCRAIKIGNHVYISGTVAIKDNKVDAPKDPTKQAERCLQIIEDSLAKFGMDRSNIFRTRMFVTDISYAKEFGSVHGNFFRGSPPVTSMLEVKNLISPEFLIEIEADACEKTEK
jgi:enamine deaminase RidA (YjgF/YER057c/UK114 family)